MRFNSKLSAVVLIAATYLCSNTHLAAQDDNTSLSTQTLEVSAEQNSKPLEQDITVLNEQKQRIDADSNDVIEIIAELEAEIESSKQEIQTLENQLARALRLLTYKQKEMEEVDQQISELDLILNPTPVTVNDDKQYNTQLDRDTEIVADVFDSILVKPQVTSVESQEQFALTEPLAAEPLALEPKELTQTIELTQPEEQTQPVEFEEILFQPDQIVAASTYDEIIAEEAVVQGNDATKISSPATAENQQSVTTEEQAIEQPIAVKLSKAELLIQKEMEAYQRDWNWLFTQPVENFTLLHGTYSNIDAMENSIELNALAFYEIFPKRLGSEKGKSLLLSKSASRQDVEEYRDTNRALNDSEIVNIGTLQQQQCELFISSNSAIDEINHFCSR